MEAVKNGILKVREGGADDRITLLFGGDFCPRAHGEEMVLAGRSAEILAPLQPILQSADVSFLQVEMPLTEADTPITKSGPNLRCHPRCVELLQEWGGDVTLLANNHTGDYGPGPVGETLDLLQQHGFKTVGAGRDLAAAMQPLIFRQNGFRIGVINIAENEFGMARPGVAGANPLQPFLNLGQIRALSAEVDLCIVVVHGGNETNPVPSPRVVSMCRAFVEAGASLVVNIHTHCPQGMEVWQGCPIIYSLGNFYFPNCWATTYDRECFWYSGYMARIEADREGVLSVEAIPIHFDLQAERVELLQGSEKAGYLSYLAEVSAVLSDWQNVVGYHEAWAASPDCYVATIIRNAAWKAEDFADPAKKKQLMPLRNIWTCEAHNELVCTWMKLFDQGRLEAALALWPQLSAWRRATFIQH